jgi:hypothetical protein
MPRRNRPRYHKRLCFNEAARILGLTNRERRKLIREYKALRGGDI